MAGGLALLITSPALAQTAASYTLAVVPQFSANELVKDWGPLVEQLKKETGVQLSLKLQPNIPQFENHFLSGEPDFVYLNPYHAVMAFKAKGYLPLVKDSKPLQGILFTHKDSDVKTLKDLNLKDIAFPSPNAFGAALYMRALLTVEHGVKFQPVYVKTHPNVFRHVMLKTAAAGGTVTAAFNDESPAVREQIQVIYRTPEAASHPLAVHPRVPVAVRNAVANTILGLTKTADGQTLLQAIRTPTPVAADYNRDYRPLEKLGLEKFVVSD